MVLKRFLSVFLILFGLFQAVLCMQNDYEGDLDQWFKITETQNEQEQRAAWINSMSLPMAVLKVLPTDIQSHVIHFLLKKNECARYLHENSLSAIMETYAEPKMHVEDVTKDLLLAVKNKRKKYENPQNPIQNKLFIIDRKLQQKHCVPINEEIVSAHFAQRQIIIQTRAAITLYDPYYPDICPITLAKENTDSVAISPNNKMCAYSSRDRLNIIDLETGKVETLYGSKNFHCWISGIIFSTDNSKVIFVENSSRETYCRHKVHVFDLAKKCIDRSIDIQETITYSNVINNGHYVYVAYSGMLEIFDLTDDSFERIIKDREICLKAAQILGNYLYGITVRGEILVIDLIKGKCIKNWKSVRSNKFSMFASPEHSSITANNKFFAFVNDYENDISVLDIAHMHNVLEKTPFMTAFFLHTMQEKMVPILRQINMSRIPFIQDSIHCSQPWKVAFNLFITALRKIYGRKIASETRHSFQGSQELSVYKSVL